jgi:hypothetical protein
VVRPNSAREHFAREEAALFRKSCVRNVVKRMSWIGCAIVAGCNAQIDEMAAGLDAAGEPLSYAESSGMASMEAEDFTSASAGTQSAAGASWSRTTAASGYSGAAAMLAAPNANVRTGDSTIGPRLDYAISFAQTGTYYVWVRMRGTSYLDDSIHVGVDGRSITTGGYGVFDTSGSWKWVQNGPAGRLAFNVSTAGRRTLNVWMREDGVAVDKIIVTRNASYVPSGAGAAVTPMPSSGGAAGMGSAGAAAGGSGGAGAGGSGGTQAGAGGSAGATAGAGGTSGAGAGGSAGATAGAGGSGTGGTGGSPSAPPPPPPPTSTPSCSSAYPAWPSFCLSEFEADLRTDGFADASGWRPTAPEQPACCSGGTIRINEATPAATRTAFVNAMSVPNRRIIVESTMQGAGTISMNGLSHLDLVFGPNVRVDGWSLENYSNGPGCHHIRWRGGEHGGFEGSGGFSHDLTWEGVVVAPSRWRNDGQIYCWLLENHNSPVQPTRMAILDSVCRANVGNPSNTAGGFVALGGVTNFVVAGTNAMGRPGQGPGNWGTRWDGGNWDKAHVVASWIMAEYAYANRFNPSTAGAGRTAFYTPAAYRNTTRQNTVINVVVGNVVAGPSAGTGDARGYVRSSNIVMANPSSPNEMAWGPLPSTDEWVMRDCNWSAQTSAQMSAAILASRNSGAGSATRFVCNAGTHTFTYAGAGAVPAIPAPPAINSAGLRDVNSVVGASWYPDGQPRALYGGTSRAVSDPRTLNDEAP